jgi:putative DNA primase/helicase
VLEDAKDTDRRLFLHTKNNLAESPQGLAFRLEQVIVGEGIVSSRVEWEDVPVNITANEALGADATTKQDRTAIEEAKCFLLELLAGGSVLAKKVWAEVEDAGLSRATVQRAKKELGIKSGKCGMEDGWTWSLPKRHPTKDAHVKDVSTFGADEHLRRPIAHIALPREVETPEDRG